MSGGAGGEDASEGVDTALFIEVTRGSLPLVVLAPHGGLARPADWPDRPSGCFEHDTASLELARALCDSIASRCGGARPHLVACLVHRHKLDVNRALEGATCGLGGSTEAAWRRYHGAVRDAIVRSVAGAGWCHVLDVHGQSHREAVELGFALRSADLCCSNEDLDASERAWGRFSMRSAVEWSRRAGAGSSALSMADAVRGSRSLGSMLAEAGWPAFPSSATPEPGSPSEMYFSGAYTTCWYGSDAYPGCSTTQIESPIAWRADAKLRDKFAAALGAAVVKWIHTAYGVDLGVAADASHIDSPPDTAVVGASPLGAVCVCDCCCRADVGEVTADGVDGAAGAPSAGNVVANLLLSSRITDGDAARLVRELADAVGGVALSAAKLHGSTPSAENWSAAMRLVLPASEAERAMWLHVSVGIDGEDSDASGDCRVVYNASTGLDDMVEKLCRRLREIVPKWVDDSVGVVNEQRPAEAAEDGAVEATGVKTIMLEMPARLAAVASTQATSLADALHDAWSEHLGGLKTA